MTHHAGHAGATDMAHCIEECTHCHQTCLETVRHCLEQGGEHAAPAHITLLLDCAEICRTSADFMIRRSDWHGSTCAACADICAACAESCEAFGSDRVMQQCAEACRRCEESCRQMAV